MEMHIRKEKKRQIRFEESIYDGTCEKKTTTLYPLAAIEAKQSH